MFKMRSVLRYTAILTVLAIFTLMLSGCDILNMFQRWGTATQGEESFDLFMDELFAEWVSSDALTMNYYLADPNSLGIERPESTFGRVVNADSIEEAKQDTRELSDVLNRFDYDALRVDQKTVYDIVRRLVTLSEIMASDDDFNYFTGYIRPLIGFQVQLPVLLAEFNFYTEEDIERYLDLISDTHRYFTDIIAFERERSRRGFFMSDANVDSVIEQIESYIENREDNLLITVFNDRIDYYEGLSSEQREQFKQRNRELVLNNVLLAYDDLLAAMQELRGVGAHSGGLADLPGGREYAHALLRMKVGTDKSIGQLDALLEKWLDDTWVSIMNSLSSNPELHQMLMDDSLGQIADGTPESYISDLQRHTELTFPPIDETGLEIFEVHESLQEHMSPAFYLVPAIDRFNDNVVYVNPSSINDNLFLYTVLGHESYPGHMYQTVYFLQQRPHPVRVALSNSGYSEGWATYAEMRSYFFAEISDEEAELMWNLRFYDMLLQSYADFGVNVLGWTFEEVVGLLASFNITSTEVAESIYNRVTGVPLNSLMYSIGFIELTELLDEAERNLDRDFDIIDFHRFILDFGSAPFPLIRQRMLEQINEHVTLAPAA